MDSGDFNVTASPIHDSIYNNEFGAIHIFYLLTYLIVKIKIETMENCKKAPGVPRGIA